MDPIIIRVRSLLDPNIVLDSQAKQGTAILAALPDEELMQVVKWTLIDRRSTDDVFDAFCPTADRVQVQAALRRLILLGRPIQQELQAVRDKEEAPKPLLLFSPSTNFSDVLTECSQAPKDFDVTKHLAVLAEIQKRRLIRMLEETATMPTQFMQADKINAASEGLRRILETLIGAQEKIGIIEKRPEKLDIRLQGALQGYMSGMEESSKDELIRFGERFVQMIEDKYGSGKSAG